MTQVGWRLEALLRIRTQVERRELARLGHALGDARRARDGLAALQNGLALGASCQRPGVVASGAELAGAGRHLASLGREVADAVERAATLAATAAEARERHAQARGAREALEGARERWLDARRRAREARAELDIEDVLAGRRWS